MPGLATRTPPWIAAAAVDTALAVGLAAGILPTTRAAQLDPVEVLRAE